MSALYDFNEPIGRRNDMVMGVSDYGGRVLFVDFIFSLG